MEVHIFIVKKAQYNKVLDRIQDMRYNEYARTPFEYKETVMKCGN